MEKTGRQNVTKLMSSYYYGGQMPDSDQKEKEKKPEFDYY